MNNNKKAFSIIEVLVGILIFSLGIVSVYSIIISTLNLNEYNKNYIIAVSLAKEQIELIRNIRDTNFSKIQAFNKIDPNLESIQNNLFETGSYYKIENIFDKNQSLGIKVEKIENFKEGKNELKNMENYRLCINEKNFYTYDCGGNNKKTPFYKYIKIEEVKYKEGNNEKIINDSFKVNSKVIWNKKGYKEFELNGIFTDFKRY